MVFFLGWWTLFEVSSFSLTQHPKMAGEKLLKGQINYLLKLLAGDNGLV